MRPLIRDTILTVGLILICLANIFPVEENLRLGKDLAGGVSLVYTVDVQPTDPPDVVTSTIEVLKERVNPRGLYEIAFEQQGRDRIEITMPLPNEKVKRLRDAFEAALAKLTDYEVDIDSFQAAMRARGAERESALQAMMDTPARRAILQPVLDAAKKADETRSSYEAARAALVDAQQLDQLLSAAGEADVALEKSREAVLSSVIQAENARIALELPRESHEIRDSATGQVERLPSPRESALATIRSRLAPLPDGEQTLDAVLDAHAKFAEVRKGFDDPADLIRLLQGAGVLNFRIAAQPGELLDEARLRRELKERGRDAVQSTVARWFPIHKVEEWFKTTEQFRNLRDNPAAYFASTYGLVGEERDGVFYVLLKDEPGVRLTQSEGAWALDAAAQSMDQLGRPAVLFRMNERGAVLLGELTERNIGRQMAVVLDDKVYSAPRINSRISDSGIIEGNFNPQEITYLIKTLSAGALTARLGERPLSQTVLAPELGLDNLRQGIKAAWVALIVVTVFMICYYFLSGGVAITAMLANAIIVLGVMSLQRAAFTLPGIAGVILIFGTAVDANVLIYERVREELLGGNDLRTAVRIAFKRASATIIDANVTNLIVCFVLVFTGTQEIKGFGIVLGIGTVANMFCALVLTRLCFTFLIDVVKVKRLGQLPLALPPLQRLLTPKINWMRMFPAFVVISTILVGLGLWAVIFRGERILDSEFRGGTSITLRLKEVAQPGGAPPAPMTQTRAEIESRLRRVAEEARRQNKAGAAALLDAEVVPINPGPDGVTSDRFTIRTVATDEEAIRDAVVDAYGDIVESRPALEFAGSEIETVEAGAPVFPVVEPMLGANIRRPEVSNNVASYIGGVAIVLEGFDPPARRDLLLARLDYMRNNPEYSRALRRTHELVILDGAPDAVRSAAVIVFDPSLSLFEDEAKWRGELAQNEWSLVRDALTEPTILASINTFSSAIARTFRAQAIVAVLLSFLLILIYVWVRFGSVRYSVAAIVPLIHDVLFAIGMIALAEILYEEVPALAALGIRPFRIDMGMIAAVMTIIGYSLNDTIIILDRIRENRGKLLYASQQVINNSINQTMSRTLITSGTTLLATAILFLYGGEGIASFAYTLFWGMAVGTYSSVAIAAPIVYTRKIPPAAGATARTYSRADTTEALPAGT